MKEKTGLNQQMDYSVLQFGAAGDGKENDACAIQTAIDACAGAGGGRVVLPGGRTYYASSLHLRKNVELHLEQGAVLKAHREISTYFRPNGGAVNRGNTVTGTPVTGKPAYAFLYAKDADCLRITGGGVIDGSADAFVSRVSAYYVTGSFYPRPTLLYLEHCNHITVADVTLCNAPFWTLHPAGCDDVEIRNIRILNDLDVANSDGIDPDHCTNVRITGCHITCADDCICLKNTAGNAEYGPCRNIIISNCTLISTSAAIKIGTEGVDDFENILVDQCAISRSNRGVSIQIRDGGSVRGVMLRGLMIETRRFADCWWGTGEPVCITVLDREPGKPCGGVEDIWLRDVWCDGENGVLLYAQEGRILRRIRFDRTQVLLHEKSKWLRGRYDLRPAPWEPGVLEHPSPGFFLRHVQDAVFRDCAVRFAGADTRAFSNALTCEGCEDVQAAELYAATGGESTAFPGGK